MKRNIGIFLGCGPGTIKSHEGIIKLLLSLLRCEEFRKRVVIALPSWSRNEFFSLLQSENEIDPNDLKFIMWKKRRSAFFVVHEILAKQFKKKNKIKKSRGRVIKHIEDAIIYLSSRHIFLFAMLILPLFLVALLKAFTVLLARARQIFIKKIWPKLKPWALKQKDKVSQYVYRIYYSVKTDELTKLVKYINRRKEIDLWYIPTGFWPETQKITAQKVIAIPDVVFEEFPLAFGPQSRLFETGYSQIQETMKTKAHFLCYSNHVKIEHLSRPFRVDEMNISVIRHGCTDLSSYLGKNRRARAIAILETFQKEVLKNNSYLAHFYLPSMRFIFYSSQVRPHKNILNLVKAYEILLRHRFLNLKLILTGNLSVDKDLQEYIDRRQLQNDVISFHGVSSEVLASLNHLALCSVNPTLFEGGFPFTFCEAYSVGTPSVMGRISAVLEESQDQSLNNLMLFDPYHPEDMADRIEWAINHRSKLIELQLPLYQKFAARSWQSSAKEYLNLFDRITL